MKLAVAYEDGQVFQHFGHTRQFKLYDIENGRILSAAIVEPMGQGHGALAQFLTERGADTLICGGIGAGAVARLESAGIRIYAGVSGAADDAAEALTQGTLSYDPCARCEKHDHGHCV